MIDLFCPRHGRESRRIVVKGLHCCCAENADAAAMAMVREEQEFSRKKFPGRDMGSIGLSPLTRLRVLVEEIGEVAEALDEEDANTKRNLETELAQVAACALSWLTVRCERKTVL